MTFDEIFRASKPIRLAIPQPGTSDVWILEKTMEFFGLGAPGARTWSWRRLHASLADYDPSRGCSTLASRCTRAPSATTARGLAEVTGAKRATCARPLDRRLGLLAIGTLLLDHLVREIVLVDVGDIGHRSRPIFSAAISSTLLNQTLGSRPRWAASLRSCLRRPGPGCTAKSR